ncbi:TetR family transcriptional regulator [Pseudonocardiaceae bacterium YIM PH 21723]|nr:TetR family transcriptional regulator [Pseudonocardiaceae bacterium YIM PH 21723]
MTGLGRRGVAVREAVLAAALDLMNSDGLAAASVAAIAERTGVHPTTIYRRWGTHAELIVDALSQQLDAALPLPDTGSVRSDLIEFFRSLAVYLDTPVSRSFSAAIIAPQHAEIRGRFWATRLGRAEVLLRRGIERGELPGDADVEFLLDAVGGPLLWRLTLRQEAVPAGYVERLVDLVLAGTTGFRS